MQASSLLITQKRLEDADEFAEHFERFVGHLCDAARLGASPKEEEAFAAERKWLLNHYFLIRADVAICMPVDAREDPEADPFQQLFQPACLADALVEDDGNMITRIVRTREALDAYGQSLRQMIECADSCS